MNAMQQMAQALDRYTPTPIARTTNKTDHLRRLVRQGRYTARELAATVGLSRSDLVSALLKHDIRAGHILVERGGVYVAADGVREDGNG